METIISLKNSHVSPETRSPEDQRRTLNYFLPLRPEPGDPKVLLTVTVTVVEF